MATHPELKCLTLSKRLNAFSDTHGATKGDVFLVKIIQRGKTVEERWDTSIGVRGRLHSYIKRGDEDYDLRVHDGSDRLCRLVVTTEVEG